MSPACGWLFTVLSSLMARTWWSLPLRPDNRVVGGGVGVEDASGDGDVLGSAAGSGSELQAPRSMLDAMRPDVTREARAR
jgi:hypothetical protein